jgi:TP901 family phage tail tape measure protein
MKLRRFSNSLGEIGGDLFRFGAVGTIGSIFPVKQFIEFQDQLLFIQTKLRVTDAQMKGLEVTIRNLGKSTSFTSKEVGQAAQMLAQAGFSIQEIDKSLGPALSLARAGQVDLSTAATVMARSIRTFQADTKEAERFASMFITAARLGTLDIIDLGESLKYSAGTMANFKMELSDVLGMLTTLANSGLTGSLAGTSLNTAFLNLASNAEEIQELLGITFSDEDLRNPLKALRMMEDAMKGMSGVKRAGILQDLVNIRGGRAIQGILLQGLDTLGKNIDEVRRSMDEASDSARKLDSRLGGSLRRSISALQELFISISETSEGPLTRILDGLKGAFNDLSRLSQENPRLAQTLLALPPLALAAGAGFLTMAFAVNKLASAMTPLVSLNQMLFSTLFRGIRAPGEFIRTLTDGFGGKKKPGALSSLTRMLALEKMTKLTKKQAKELSKLKKVAASSALLKNRSFIGALLSGRDSVSNGVNKVASAFTKLSAALRGFRIEASRTAGPSAGFVRGGAMTSLLPGIGPAANPNMRPDGFSKAKQLNLFTGTTEFFRQGIQASASEGIRTGLGSATFNTEAEREIANAVNKILGGKKARQALRQSSTPRRLLEARLGRVSVPEQLIPRILSDALKAVPGKATTFGKAAATQQMFDFKPVAEDLVLQMDDAVEKASKKKGRVSIASIRGEAYFAKQGATASSARKGIGLGGMVFRAISTGIKAAFSGIGTLLSSGVKGAGSGIASGVRSLFRVDYIRKLFQGFTMMGRALRGVFFVLNNIRRAVFSLSGILTIIELLIIIGPKVRPIREFFNAVGDFFKDVAGIKDKLAPAFKTFGLGMQQIFGGKLADGAETLKIALTDIANIVKIGLSDAWAKFYEKTRPLLDRLRAVFNGILETVRAIIGSIASVGGASINALIPEGSGGSLPGVDAINTFFAGAFAFVREFARQFVTVMDVVIKGIDSIIHVLYLIYNSFAGWFGKGNVGLPAPLRLDTAGINAELDKLKFNPFKAGSDETEKTGEALGNAVGKAGKNFMDRVLEDEFGNIPGPEPESKPEEDIQAKLSALFKPTVELNRFQETLVAARLDQLRNERNVLEKNIKGTKELEQAARKFALASEGGSFAKTRGNLLKSFKSDIDKKRNELLEKGNEELQDMNGKMDEMFRFN